MRREATTSFVGREEDLRALAELFASGERMVTLLGPGGMGKTRLARRFMETRPVEQSVFCDLVDAASVVDACGIACANLGVWTSSSDALDQLASVLASRGRITLVLDNVEHLAAELPPVLARLLSQAPEARLLLTSRVSLRMPEEVAYELGPLSLPKSAEGLRESEAAQLWAARALRARKGYSLDHEDGATLADLLSRLDGNPLAIELAASRLRVLSPAAILDKLGDRISVLSAAGGVWDDRHRALGSVIETSWDALTGGERSALAQLTVFAGSFSTADAEAVVATQGERVADLLQSLREQSLLTAPEPERLALYETVRAFASTELPDRAAVEARHAKHFGQRALEILGVAIESAAQRVALQERLDADRANFLAAAERDRGAAAVFCLAVLDVLHPARDPGVRYVQLATGAASALLEHDSRSLAAAYATLLLAHSERRAGAYARAEELLSTALTLAIEHRATTLEADVRVARASARFLQGKEDVESDLSPVFDAAPLPARARAWLTMGQLRQSQWRFDEARAWLERAVEGLEAATPAELAFGLLCLFEVYLELGARDLAQDALARAKVIQARIGDRRLSVMVGNMESWSSLLEGSAGAAESYGRAIELVPAGASILAAHLLGWQGLAFFATGRPADAIVALERATAVVTAKAPLAIFVSVLGAARALVDPSVRLPASTEPWEALLHAFVEVERSEGAAATRALDAARARLTETHGAPGSLARLTRRLLTDAVAKRSAAPKVLRIEEGGESFSRSSGAPVRLRGQVLVKTVLMALANAHARGEGVSIADLFAIAWPGERASAQSVDERVRAVIKRLRRAGLEDLIEAHKGGFRFTPGTVIHVS